MRTHDLTCHRLSLHLFVCKSAQVSPGVSVPLHLCLSPLCVCSRDCVCACARCMTCFCLIQNASAVSRRPCFPSEDLHSAALGDWLLFQRWQFEGKQVQRFELVNSKLEQFIHCSFHLDLLSAAESDDLSDHMCVGGKQKGG